MPKVGIDALIYRYADNSNKLLAVSDATNNPAGFSDGNTSGDDYAYDAAGSLTKDGNKGISSIAYNHLKLPRQVSFSNGKVIDYQYDAAGAKLRMSVAGGEVREYVGNQVWLNGSLFEVAHEEGRYTPTGGYEFFLPDHLGNVRVVVNGSGQAVQQRDYDPWGLVLGSGGGSSNRRTYNGKEALAELGDGVLDYGARLYDAPIGRWSVIDALAEKWNRVSPYIYTLNNPLTYSDPDGRDVWINYGNGQRIKYDNGKLYNEDGSKYKGKDAFVSAVVGNLNKINSTDIGKYLLSSLSKSDNDFTFTNTNALTKDGQVVQGMSFSPNEQGGGEIRAGSLLSVLGKQSSQESKNIESIAHEMFHGFQNDNGEKGATINKEVGAYLFGRAVSLNLGYGTDSFGNFSDQGKLYEKSMQNLMYSNAFNQKDYNSAVSNFKVGSVANNGTGGQIYGNFPLIPNQLNPAIRRFFPLLR